MFIIEEDMISLDSMDAMHDMDNMISMKDMISMESLHSMNSEEGSTKNPYLLYSMKHLYTSY